MKRREQALLFLRKAAQDESLLDAVLECDSVSDEVIGFHCQQAAEKMLKALLSDLGITFHKTHELGALMDSLARSGAPLPGELATVLDAITPMKRKEKHTAPKGLAPKRPASKHSVRR